MAKPVVLLFILLSLTCGCQSGKILGIFHLPSPSHYFIGSVLFKALARRGHELTVINPYPQKSPLANYTDISVASLVSLVESLNPTLVDLPSQGIYEKMRDLTDFCPFYTDLVLGHEEVQKLLNSQQTFDLIIMDSFFNDAFLGFSHKYKAPVMYFSTVGMNVFTNYITGNLSPYAFVPNLFTDLSDKMSFFERIYNTYANLLFAFLHKFTMEQQQRDILKKYFEDAPLLEDLQKSVALVLSNSDVSVETPRPFLPIIKQVIGLQLGEEEEMPPDLAKEIESSKNGVIYLSFGSNIRSADLPREKQEVFIRAFEKLDQKVLWKWEDDNLPGKPSNIIIRKWFPQKAVLAHPNVRLFISHGGLLGTTEAVYYGVPVLGIPFYGDQGMNIKTAVKAGYGRRLDLPAITEQNLLECIKTLLEDKSYKINAEKRSIIMRDKPIKPLDEAIYWTEYVMRHNGAPHLRSASADLSWFQYLLLDIVLFFAIVVLTLWLMMGFILRKTAQLLRLIASKKCCSVKNTKQTKKKTL